jgi:hypothetical protein
MIYICKDQKEVLGVLKHFKRTISYLPENMPVGIYIQPYCMWDSVNIRLFMIRAYYYNSQEIRSAELLLKGLTKKKNRDKIKKSNKNK